MQIAQIIDEYQGLKSVIANVGRLLMGGKILKRFVNDLSLLDLNTFIEPLEQIGQRLTSYMSSSRNYSKSRCPLFKPV